MEKPIMIPELGDDIKTVKLVEWLVKRGDIIKKGDAVAVVETEKVAFEVEAPEDGVIERLQCSEGDKINVSKPIAYIVEPDENTPILEEQSQTEQETISGQQKLSYTKQQRKGFRHILKRITER